MKRKELLVLVFALGMAACSRSFQETVQTAREKAANGEYQAAVNLFQSALTKTTDSTRQADVLVELGDLYLEKMDSTAAAGRVYGQALKLAADWDAAHLREVVQKCLQAGNAADAVIGYKRWLRLYTDNDLVPSMLYELAEVYHKDLRNLPEAVVVYRKLADEYPDSEFAPKALFSVGYIYANDLNKLDLARQAYNQFLERYPNHEMVPSVKFELRYLGKSLEEIPELKNLLQQTS